ncbi:hypothetical protein N0V90_007423 [Kalmusia sp. IMI 367209]|nr:hypothetical protein N0V90_007423 [Kalmusia sp. IMI 367209]
MLTFDLAVLSHSADLPPEKPVPAGGWTKLTRGLVVVFDTFRSGGEPAVIMKIMQATQVLNLIDRSKPVIAKLHRQGIDVSSEAHQLPISGMASSPLLALRYNLPDVNKVRRIQLKFVSPQDFDVAYDHVRELGLWFTPVHKARPPTSIPQVPRIGPSCPPSQLSEINHRPGTAVSSISTPLQNQLKDAAGTRPSTGTFFNSNSTASSRRPDSAASMSPYERPHEFSYAARPDTANSFTRPISDELPPRRELPFERLDTPESRGNESIRSESRPMSGVMGPPVLPASALAGATRANPRVDSQITGLPPLRKPTYLSSSLVGQAANPLSNLGDEDSMRPQSAMTSNNYSAMQQIMSSPPVLTPTLRPATSSITTTRSPLSANVTNADLSRSRPELSASLPTPFASDDNMLGSEGNRNNGTAEEQLTAYAKQTNVVRVDELNDFIFQHLKDDNFLTLVDDMQMAWARIGSGLE